jgi:hypothetical protein
MDYSNNLKFSGNLAIYQIEREELQEITPRASNMVWLHLRVLVNSFDGTIKFRKKGICR